MQRPTVSTVSSDAAVKRLRAANAAAEKADDGNLHSDGVEAELAVWRCGKTDNLRALLQSMDAVLWPELGVRKLECPTL